MANTDGIKINVVSITEEHLRRIIREEIERAQPPRYAPVYPIVQPNRWPPYPYRPFIYSSTSTNLPDPNQQVINDVS